MVKLQTPPTLNQIYLQRTAIELGIKPKGTVHRTSAAGTVPLTEWSLSSEMTVFIASSTASALKRSTVARQVQVAITQSRDTLQGQGERRGEGGGGETVCVGKELC